MASSVQVGVACISRSVPGAPISAEGSPTRLRAGRSGPRRASL